MLSLETKATIILDHGTKEFINILKYNVVIGVMIVLVYDSGETKAELIEVRSRKEAEEVKVFLEQKHKEDMKKLDALTEELINIAEKFGRDSVKFKKKNKELGALLKTFTPCCFKIA